MSASPSGKQLAFWIWAVCGGITLIDHWIAAVNFAQFGAVAAMGFITPILLVILYVVVELFGV